MYFNGFLNFYLFIFGWAGSSLLPQAGAAVHGSARAFHCEALLAVERRLQYCSSQALEGGLGSCGARTQLPCGIWDLPEPGIKPMSPKAAGGFLTTRSPGKSLNIF